MEELQTADVAGPQKASGKLSFRGLWEVIAKPTAFFEELKDNPKILVPYLTILIVSLVFFWLTLDIIVKMQLDSPEVQERLQGTTVTPQIMQFMRYNVLIGGILAVMLSPLIAAGFAVFWGNFVFAGKARFKLLLSIMLYGEIIHMLGLLVVLPMVLVKKTILVGLSLGVLAVGQGPGSLLYLALSKIDLFIIWEIIAIGIAFSVVYPFSRNKGYVLSVLSMGMLSILHVVFTAVSKLLF
jgi:hypothetical protein